MTNPLITYAMKKLSIPESVDIYKLIITYKDGNISPNVALYLEMDTEEDFFTLEEKTHPMDIEFAVDLEKLCNLLQDLTGHVITMGTDRKSIYIKESHRHIDYLRFVIPDGLLQIDFEDEQTAEDTTDYMYEFMRSHFQSIG